MPDDDLANLWLLMDGIEATFGPEVVRAIRAAVRELAWRRAEERGQRAIVLSESARAMTRARCPTALASIERWARDHPEVRRVEVDHSSPIDGIDVRLSYRDRNFIRTYPLLELESYGDIESILRFTLD